MSDSSTCRSLRASQRAWAARLGLDFDRRGYVTDLRHNLLRPLSPETQLDFSQGSGAELGGRQGRRPPKMRALHSSSALACNVFDYWRSNGIELLREALDLPSPIQRLQFEAQFPTGLRGKPPNLDLGFFLQNRSVWAIESKFTEPYCSATKLAALKDKYFPGGQPIWGARGLPRCARLAASLKSGHATFHRLDAAQLLKHVLGLRHKCGERFTLVYLYVHVTGSTGEQHVEELGHFSDAVAGDFPFVATTYFNLLRRLRLLAGSYHDAYFDYLTARYHINAGSLKSA